MDDEPRDGVIAMQPTGSRSPCGRARTRHDRRNRTCAQEAGSDPAQGSCRDAVPAHIGHERLGDDDGSVRLLAGGKPGKVLYSHNNDYADRCVDVFVRPDGTYGFEEYRRDPEDMGAWSPMAYHSGLSFATREEAWAQQRAASRGWPNQKSATPRSLLKGRSP